MALVHSNRVAIQIQIKLRAQLTSAVYRKAVRLSSRCDTRTLIESYVIIAQTDSSGIYLIACLHVAPVQCQCARSES